MSIRNCLLLLAAGLLLPGAVASASVMMAEKGSACIENSGSTNSLGYEIYVGPSGNVNYIMSSHSESGRNHFSTEARQHEAKISKTLAANLFRDIAAAGPLSALPMHHGMRSASFGTSTYLMYKEQRSPDLTFPGNPQALALHNDITEIVKVLHFPTLVQRPIQPSASPKK